MLGYVGKMNTLLSLLVLIVLLCLILKCRLSYSVNIYCTYDVSSVICLLYSVIIHINYTNSAMSVSPYMSLVPYIA